MEEETLFLTVEEVLNAICLDFRGYDPQPMLFCEVLRAVHGNAIAYKREFGKDGLWISTGPSHRMRWMAGTELVAYMCRIIIAAQLPLAQLVRLCRQIFQTPCHPATSQDTEEPGILIETGIDRFHCKQCGLCCSQLDYRNGITAQDVQRLEQLGRKDVLEWVGRTKTKEGQIIYRMWVIPETNQYAPKPCPFLKPGPTNAQYICSIHDVKPTICRSYPISRKHASMTGCPGFE